MRKLVLLSFKGRKRELRISIVMLVLIYMCGIMTILFQESFIVPGRICAGTLTESGWARCSEQEKGPGRF